MRETQSLQSWEASDSGGFNRRGIFTHDADLQYSV